MREIILTDIHGCYDELRNLLKEVDFGRGDVIVGASDAVDKGPESAQVVRFLRQLDCNGQLVRVKGNHEVKFVKFANRYKRDPQRASEHKYAANMLKTLSALDDSDIEWLSQAALWAPLSQFNGIVVHAGFEPGMRHLPPVGNMADSDIESASALIYCRYIKNGKMVRLGSEDDSCQFWADLYDGRWGHVFYGHQPWLMDEPRLTSNTSGLDLGCVVGGRLAAAVLESGKVHYASVPGAQYAALYKKESK
jgi:serine/threonine protein phosphatase 1